MLERHPYKTGDSIRALLNDTSPAELPLYWSNVGIHHNLRRLGLTDRKGVDKAKAATVFSDPAEWVGHLVAKVLASTSPGIPLEIDVLTPEGKRRTVCLPHLRSQWHFALFMHSQSDKILHYCSLSPASLRAPSAIGSDVVPRRSIPTLTSDNVAPGYGESNDEQSADVEVTAGVNVKRFFTYRGYRKLYRFFDSEQFQRLEEQFPYLLMLDVQSAFPSIYTHSLSWAIRGKPHSKRRVAPPDSDLGRSEPFASEFDRLMQDANWKETNGIIVGPELSRIFAEIILQHVDVSVARMADTRLRESNGRNTAKYELHRYVDDFFVFADSEQTAHIVQECLESKLDEFNLRLNVSKSEKLSRPFMNAHGLVSAEIADLIQRLRSEAELLRMPVEQEANADELQHTRMIQRWKRTCIRDVRKIMASSPSGASLAVSRVPGALLADAIRLLDGIDDAPQSEIALRANRAWAIVEVLAYLVSVSWCETAMSRFCGAVLVCLRLNELAGGVTGRLRQFELLFERCVGLIEIGCTVPVVPLRAADVRRGNVLLCNLVACMSQFPAPFHFSETELWRHLKIETNTFDGTECFEVLTICFYGARVGRPLACARDLISRIWELFRDGTSSEAGTSFLAMELLGCPRIDVKLRRKLLRKVASAIGACSAYVKTNATADAVLHEFERHSWAVSWGQELTLLRLLQRKIASETYR